MRYIERYRPAVRMNHWAVALLFLCAGASGMAFFHPLFFPLTQFFGGGTWTRILHPYFGVLMCLGFAVLFLQVWRDNVIQRTDVEWLKAAPKMIRSARDDGMPPVAKYNPGQKLVVWAFAASLVLLFVTGFVFWQPWFADAFPVPARRVAVVVHAAAAFVLVMSVIVHVYAALWIKGTMRAMLRGTVSDAWARHHHPLWYRKLTGRADN